MFVSRDAPCRRCGYNLRSLSVDSRCTECGTPVAFSLTAGLLRFSDPAWLRKILQGVGFVMSGILAGILPMIVAVLGMNLFQSTLPLLLAALLAIALYSWGNWQLTTPDPSGLGEDEYGKVRQLARIATTIGVPGLLTSPIRLLPGLPAAVKFILILISTLVIILVVVGQFGLLSYLSKLARRIPNDAMAADAKLIMYAIGIPELFIAFYMAGSNSVGFAGRSILVLRAVMGMAVLIAVAMNMAILRRWGLELRDARAAAMQRFSACGVTNK